MPALPRSASGTGGADCVGGASAVAARRRGRGPFARLLLLRSSNEAFAEDAELALRGAFVTAALALPLAAPETAPLPVLGDAARQGLLGPGTILYFLFSFYRTTGETVELVVSGILGVALALANSWIMFGLFPHGMTLDTPSDVFLASAIECTVFLFLMMWLNLNPNAMVFACSCFVWYMMEFLEPGPDSMSSGFNINIHGAEMQDMVGIVVGGSLAVLATLLPWPILAISKAHETAMHTTLEMGQMWEDLADYDCSAQSNVYRAEALARDLQGMYALQSKLSACVTNSWWESFASPSWRRSRIRLRRFEASLDGALDCLFAARGCCLLEDFGPRHEALMARLGAEVKRSISSGSALLECCADVVADRCADGTERSRISEGLKGAAAAAASLSRELRDARGGGKSAEEFFGIVQEQAFCAKLCEWLRLVQELALELQDDIDGTKPLPALRECRGLRGVFDVSVLRNQERALHAVRSLVQVFAGFWLGFGGYGRVVRKHDADIASTITLMLNRFEGAAMAKNLMRLQGVVVGTLAGLVFASLLPQCALWSLCARVVVVLVWSFGGLLTYLNCSQTLGLYVALYGSLRLANRCAANNSPADTAGAPSLQQWNVFSCCWSCVAGEPEAFTRAHALSDAAASDSDFVGSYYKFSNIFVALLVIVAVDLLLPSKNACNAAADAFEETWHALCGSFDTGVRRARGSILSRAVAAEALSVQAGLEPRLWRPAWRLALFARALESARRVRISLDSFEGSLLTDGAMMKQAKALASFGDVQGMVKAKFSLLGQLLQIFRQGSLSRAQDLDDLNAWRDDSQAWLKALKTWCAEAGAIVAAVEAAGGAALDDDPQAQLGVAVVALDLMMKEMQCLQRSILRD